MSFNMPLPPALKTDPTKHPRNKTENGLMILAVTVLASCRTQNK